MKLYDEVVSMDLGKLFRFVWYVDFSPETLVPYYVNEYAIMRMVRSGIILFNINFEIRRKSYIFSCQLMCFLFMSMYRRN